MLKAKVVHVRREQGAGGWFYASSPDLRGLLVAEPTLDALEKAIPEAIADPLRRFDGAGPIDPRRAARVIDAWVVGFFDHVFKGKELPDPAQTPEAVLEIWPAPAVKSRATIDAPAKSIVLQQ